MGMQTIGAEVSELDGISADFVSVKLNNLKTITPQDELDVVMHYANIHPVDQNRWMQNSWDFKGPHFPY